MSRVFNNVKRLGLSVLVLCAAVSCTQYTDIDRPSNNKSLLVKSPEILAYSGGQDLGSDSKGERNRWRAAYMNANMYDQDWDCIPNVNLSDEEMAELIDMFCIGHEIENTEILPFENYWVQQVYKGEAQYHPTDINGNEVSGTTITGSDHMDKLIAHNLQTEYKQVWEEWNNWSGSWEYVTTEYEHVNNFNNGNNTNNPGQCGCGISHLGTTLMVDMSTTGITPSNQFGFHESYGTSHNYNNYIILQYKGEWYVGFDYEMHKEEARNPNEAKDVERDWCFTDWIVKITPAYHKGTTPEIGEEPEVQDPDSTIVPEIKGEVEINLHADDKNGEYLESHLSIHVRTATDVEVFIPVPAEYYCEKDDMAIVMKHEVDFMLHAGPIEMEYTLAGQVVKLTVKFEEGGIRITTDGIDQEVIDFCAEELDGDGITFEIWNYFNDVLDLERLKGYLNQATVRFLDKTPEKYVNAFNEHSGVKEEDDCTVSIVDDQRGEFGDPKEGEYLNNSPYNKIYTKN